jgi:acyl-homoserine lactone acylase PvdQ
VAPPVSGRLAPADGDLGEIGAALRRALRGSGHASNWELVAARNSRTGHPIGVLGPQVGYYVPQILMEVDLHGPGIDARGATFPGIGLYVLLGHGRDYAWSATAAGTDNIDTFAEVLCRDAFHYRYKGRCLAMEKLVRQNSWRPSQVDDTPAGSETLTAYRTEHGIVFARGTVKGRRVAFVLSRSTYFHEADSAVFFSRINDPRFMRSGPKAFFAAAKFMNFTFNWAYLDSRHIAYQLTGWHPQRARGTSPDFPILGTGQYDWKGYDPRDHVADWTPFARLPHAVGPDYLVSWNNKQAPGWAAADDQYGYGPVYRSQMIAEKIRHGIRGGRKMSLAQLVQAMEGPATQDIRGYKLLPIIFRAIGMPAQPALRRALATLRSWRRAGSHRRDLDGDGIYEHNRAVELMDAWWPKLIAAQFRPVLGAGAYETLRDMIDLGGPGFGPPEPPAFSDGWYGYASKDLRALYGPRPRGAYSRVYCGKGSKAACRTALRASLRAALRVTPEDLYAFGDCVDDPRRPAGIRTAR